MNIFTARKAVRRTWYQILRASFRISYAGLLVFSVLSRNFILAAVMMGLALLSGPFFCGWACPLGTVQDWLGRIGRRLMRGKRLRVPERVERFLFLQRYVLMILGFLGSGFLVWISYLSRPYQDFMGILAGNTAYIGAVGWGLLGLLAATSLVMDRPFCRYFCTEGARYGILSLARVVSIRRDARRCIDCGACDRACPSQVRISDRSHVRHPQCINCLECVSTCPAQGALGFGPVIGWKRKTTAMNEGAENDEKTA